MNVKGRDKFNNIILSLQDIIPNVPAMIKVLFLHGLASSGSFKTAASLRKLLDPCEVIAPDIPIDPDEAWAMLRSLCDDQKPDLVVGLSLGGQWAQRLRCAPTVLINPGFRASLLMRVLIGQVSYLSPRANGEKTFLLTEEICRKYERIEERQFEGITDLDISRTRGMFAIQDEITQCGDLFEAHYPGAAHYYDGGHLPTHKDLRDHCLPLIQELI